MNSYFASENVSFPQKNKEIKNIVGLVKVILRPHLDNFGPILNIGNQKNK